MTKTETTLMRAITLLKFALADLEGEIGFIDPDFDGENPHPARITIAEIKTFLEGPIYPEGVKYAINLRKS